MTDTPSPRAGRHRQRRTTGLSRPSARPAQALLKAVALGTTATGVATALLLPSGQGWDFSPTASEPSAVAVSAPAAAAPVRQTSFGLIGFQATAKPTPKPVVGAEVSGAVPAPAHVEKKASRSAGYSRAAIPGMSGMSQNAVAVINEVHRAFPQLSDIGGYRAGDPGDHGSGHAVDVMCGTSDGDALAAHLQGMAGTLNITYIIWKQRIWYPGGGGWEAMEDRGSATANHYDHVHISVS